MVPRVVQAKLKRLRSHARALVTLEGLGRLLTVAGVLVVLTFLFDWATPLPAALRLILVILCLGLLSVTLWRSLVVPLAARRSDDQIALCVERAHPDLHDRLISTVQLARLGPEEGFFNSPEMVEALVEETEQEVGGWRFPGVFSPAPAMKAWLAAGAFIILIGGFAAFKSETAGLYLERYLTPFSARSWPRYNELTVVDYLDKIAKGDDIEIKVESVGRRHPSTVTIYSKFDSQSAWEDSLMLKYGVSSFKKLFENVNEGFRFYAEGGDAQTGEYRVEVKTRPHIEKLKVWLRYPGYTGLEDTPVDSPIPTGNVQVPAGTVVEFEAAANNPLARARLKGEGIEVEKGKETWGTQEIENATTFRGSFVARKSTHYAFELTDTWGFDNFTNHKPVTYNLRVTMDRPPSVRIVRPARNSLMTPEATLRLTVEIKDEYGIKDAALKYYKVKESEQSKVEPQTLEFKDEKGEPVKMEGEKEVSFNYDFDLEPLKARVGDMIIYYAASSDFNDVGRPQPGRSRKWKITVETADELRRTYQNRLARLKDRLKAVRRNQKLIMIDVSEVSREVALAGHPDKAMQRSMLNIELDQHKVTRELEGGTGELSGIVAGMRANKLYTEQDYEMWENLNARLGVLAKRVSPEVAEEINDLRKEEPEAGYELAFDQIYKEQAGLVRELDEIIKKLEEIADFNEVIQEVRKILELQKQVRDEAAADAKGQGGFEKDEEDKKKKQLQDLEEVMRSLADKIEEKQPDEAKKLRGTWKRAREKLSLEDMETMRRCLLEGQPIPAVRRADKDVQNLLELLNYLIGKKKQGKENRRK